MKRDEMKVVKIAAKALAGINVLTLKMLSHQLIWPSFFVRTGAGEPKKNKKVCEKGQISTVQGVPGPRLNCNHRYIRNNLGRRNMHYCRYPSTM